jgi:hypothetical protein
MLSGPGRDLSNKGRNEGRVSVLGLIARWSERFDRGGLHQSQRLSSTWETNCVNENQLLIDGTTFILIL